MLLSHHAAIVGIDCTVGSCHWDLFPRVPFVRCSLAMSSRLLAPEGLQWKGIVGNQALEGLLWSLSTARHKEHRSIRLLPLLPRLPLTLAQQPSEHCYLQGGDLQQPLCCQLREQQERLERLPRLKS